MTLNLKPGDYARDKDGNVYGPLKWKRDQQDSVLDPESGLAWWLDGTPVGSLAGEVCLVCKVRPVFEDVPPEPVRERVRGKVVFTWFNGIEGGGVVEPKATLTLVDGKPDWSTLRVTE